MAVEDKRVLVHVVHGRVIIDMGAAKREKPAGRRGKERRGDSGERGKRTRKGERKKCVYLSSRLESQGEGCWESERRCETKTKRRVFCQHAWFLATVRWRPPLSGKNHAIPPTLFPDLSPNRLHLPVAGRECHETRLWCCHRSCRRRFFLAKEMSIEFRLGNVADYHVMNNSVLNILV